MAGGLNKRQEAFCLQWFKAEGVARRAYMAAGYKVSGPRVADACASRLLTNANVAARIRSIQAMVQKRAADVTADTLIADLARIAESAMDAGQHGPAVAAVMGQAKITGHIVERKESGKPGDFERMSEDELRAYLKTHMPQAHAPVMQTNADEDSADVSSGAQDESVSGAPVPAPTHGGTDSTQ